MTKSPSLRSRMAALRKVIGKSQTQFAAMLGVSKHTIISVENGRNQLSENLTRRIKIATGADMSRLSKGKIAAVGGGQYSKNHFEKWRVRFSSEEHSAKARFEEIKYWIELVFRAAAKPGVAGIRDRLPAVYLSLVEWLHNTREGFKLEQEIDDILEDDPHEIVEIIYDYESLKADASMAGSAAAQLDLKPEDVLKLFKQQMRGLKSQNKVYLEVKSEIRKAWHPERGEIAHAVDPCKVKRIMPKAEFRFVKFIHSRKNPARQQLIEYLGKKVEATSPTSDTLKLPPKNEPKS